MSVPLEIVVDLKSQKGRMNEIPWIELIYSFPEGQGDGWRLVVSALGHLEEDCGDRDL